DWAPHVDLAEQIAGSAVTVVGDPGELPLTLQPEDRLGVVTVTAGNLTPAETAGAGASALVEQVGRRHANVASAAFPFGASGPGREAAIREVLERVRDARTVLFASVDAATDHAQRSLFEALLERGHDVIVLALRSP